MSAVQEKTVKDAQTQFEDWYVQNAYDYAANPIGSRDCGLMRRAWHAALAATGKQQAGAVPAFTAAVDAVHLLADYLGDAPQDLNLDHEISLLEARDAIAYALAARQPGAQVPVATSAQPGKRVSILESACGPARKFDPVAADAELASVPLVPLWELPELHPRKVADECLTTMEQVRQGTKPHTSRRHKLTEAIALTKRFIEQQERSERLGTAPPAQGIDLGQFRTQVAELLRMEFDLEVADPEDHRHDDGASEAERIASKIAALIEQRDAAPGVGNG